MNNSVLVYDIEIKRCVPDSRNANGINAEINPVTGLSYEYCKGWEDYAGMDVAVLAVWDCERSVSTIYDESTIGQFAELVRQRQLVTGFNVLKFDHRICEVFGVEIPKWKTFDVYRESLIACGLNPDERTPGGRNLNEFARVNFGAQKIRNGADAPKMYQRGEIFDLINYCIDDTMLERRLFEKARRGQLIDPVTRKTLELNVPEQFRIQ